MVRRRIGAVFVLGLQGQDKGKGNNNKKDLFHVANIVIIMQMQMQMGELYAPA